MLSRFRGFYIFLEEAGCSVGNKKKSFFFKGENSSQWETIQKKLDFQVARRQKPLMLIVCIV